VITELVAARGPGKLATKGDSHLPVLAMGKGEVVEYLASLSETEAKKVFDLAAQRRGIPVDNIIYFQPPKWEQCDERRWTGYALCSLGSLWSQCLRSLRCPRDMVERKLERMLKRNQDIRFFSSIWSPLVFLLCLPTVAGSRYWTRLSLQPIRTW